MEKSSYTKPPWTVRQSYEDPTAIIIEELADKMAVVEVMDVEDDATQEATAALDGEVAADLALVGAAPELYEALSVMVLDPKISAWLDERDPMALRQAIAALHKVARAL